MSRNDAAARRRRRRLSGVAVPLSILLGSLLVWQSSQAAFVDSKETGSNQWDSNTLTGLTITGNDPGPANLANSVIFSQLNIRPDYVATALPQSGFTPDTPGTSGGSKCINVNYDGDPANVRLYASARAGDTELLNALVVRVDRGTNTPGVAATDCSAFVPTHTVYGVTTTDGQAIASFPASFNAASAASGQWTTVGSGQSNSWYRISWLLPQGASGTASNQSVTATFKWEARLV